MNKNQVILRLFNLQTTDEKLEIIRFNNLTFKGFSNITKQLIENKSEFINIKLTSNSNVNKIFKNINNRLRIEKDNMDYLLSAEKIIEKYHDNWSSLLIVFEKDEYGETTKNILDILEGNKNVDSLTIDSKEKKSTGLIVKSNEDEIAKLRRIIEGLEKDIKNRDNRLNTYVKDNNDNFKRIEQLKENNSINKESLEKTTRDKNKLISDIKELQHESINLIDENEKLRKNINENENYCSEYKNEIVLLKKEIEVYKNKIPHINIIGLPMAYRMRLREKKIKIIEDGELWTFISNLEAYTADEIVVYKLGISGYNLHLLKNKARIFEINNLKELDEFIEEKVL